jgi:starch synthase
VLNGIDTQDWDPAADAALPAPYSAAAPQGKALCKAYLQRGLGMTVDPGKPLVAVISRLVPQKGIHLIEAAVGRAVAGGGQFVLLGTGHADAGLRALAEGEFK